MQCYPSARGWRQNVFFKLDPVDVSHFLAESQMTYLNDTVLWGSRHSVFLSGCFPLHFVVHPVLSISQISALTQRERSNDHRWRSLSKWLCFALKIAMEEKRAPGKIEALKELSGHKTRQKTYCFRVGKL